MRYAVFVDAGYLYAQGSAAIAGHPAPRFDVELDCSKAIARLLETAASRTGGAPLLRIYWYDGLLRRELSADQRLLAFMENVKLRLGIVNWAGQQKGVDSLIVTDLVELARNQAISDAILLSGDEDLRIGVQIAQSFGVRGHLIGIEPGRGSQSIALLQEADTTTEWNKADMSDLLTLKPGFYARSQASGDTGSPEVCSDAATALEQAIRELVTSLDLEEIRLIDKLGDNESIPPEFDRKLLATCRTKLGRDLNGPERFKMRGDFRDRIRDKAKDL